MKILKIIHGYPPDYNAGSEVYSQSVCNELKKRHEVVVFTREENLYAPDYQINCSEDNGLRIYRGNMAREKDGYNHPVLNQAFGQLLEKERPDIAHIGHLNHLSTGVVDELKQRNIPIVFTLHDFWLMCPRGQFLQVNFGNPSFHQLCEGQEHHKCATHCYNRFFSGQRDKEQEDIRYWESWIAQRMETTEALIDKVDLFIAPSRYLMNRFLQDFHVPEHKMVYLDYGFPMHYLSPVTKEKRDAYTFGYIGTHIPAKGVDMLIEAFAQVQGNVQLKIWGRANGQSTRYLKKKAIEAPQPIHFLGEYVNSHLASQVLSQVDAIVVPSIWAENSPLVIHEAQACRIPVITADFGGMKEYVSHQQNGLLFKHRDAMSLLEQLQYAIDHPQEMDILGSRGYLHSEDGSVPDIVSHCQQLESYYHQIKQNYGVKPLENHA